MPKPSAEWLSEDVAHYRALGINRIASLLTKDEAEELGLANEDAACVENHVAFCQYPIADREVPARHDFAGFAQMIAGELTGNRNVAIHCRAGIGRAGLLACCVLQLLDITPEDAIRMVTDGRGVAVPDTDEQREFILSFAAT